MKIVSIVGARPQFIKATPVSRALRGRGICELLVHTGQHYDDNMSELFFRELEIPKPDFNLQIGSGTHGWQTGQMLVKIEQVLITEKPDWVIVYGDTNSTLAGALAAVKLMVPLAHVEAGLRSYNKRMPEEHNRIMTDHCSTLLFCPTETAIINLRNEGISKGAIQVGDTMVDSILQFTEKASKQSRIIERLKLVNKEYMLATVHRAENTDSIENLSSIFKAFIAINEKIVFPVHPRTLKIIREIGLDIKSKQSGNIKMIDPVGYLDMLMLEKNAKMILTDSGGIQKEAYVFQVPCVTLREETEWVETVQTGWNKIAGTNVAKIVNSVRSTWRPSGKQKHLFGDGMSAIKIVSEITKNISCYQ